MNSQVFTTGQIARHCKVAPRTVSKWCNQGLLKHWRIPGSTDLRTSREYLVEFLKQHGMPLGELENHGCLLLVSQDGWLEDELRRLLSLELKVVALSSGFELGARGDTLAPCCIIVDYAIGVAEADNLCAGIQRTPMLAAAALIALLGGAGESKQNSHSSAAEVFRKPFDPQLLAERVRILTNQVAKRGVR